ncbi:glycosyl transferase [Planctomycetales bacterium]|nr:glycosyl transferase [Planctomycetales bacterium]
MLHITHITASPSFGGPERQMLELGRALEQIADVRHIFASFREGGNSEPFLAEIVKRGFPSYRFENDMPHLLTATSEMIRFLKQNKTDVLCAHGHKARILGWIAARRLGIPIIGISRGWTGENWKIRLFETLDRWMHRRMNHVVCVSQGQADKVIKAGTPPSRISVIRNSIRTERFDVPPDAAYRQKLESLFKTPPQFILGAAGRLSPEKGFDILLESVAKLTKQNVPAGLVLFGEGFLQESLQTKAAQLGVTEAVSFAGFTNELDRFMPYFDIFVQSSYTEGLPNVLLEAMAARTAVVATEVGGTNEVVVEGETGLMVPSGNAEILADAVQKVLQDDMLRKSMGQQGRKRVEDHFTFEAQAAAYWDLFQQMAAQKV